MPNLTRRDLRGFLPQHDLSDDELDLIILMVRAWLLEDTELEVLPDPLGDILWAGALELAALLADNRTSLSQRTSGPTSRSWPMAPVRDAIRNRIRLRYRRTAMQPQGSYPAPLAHPEPAEHALGGTYVPAGPYHPAYGWLRAADGSWVYVG